MKKTIKTVKPAVAKAVAKKTTTKAPAKTATVTKPVATSTPPAAKPAKIPADTTTAAVESLRQEITALRSQLAKSLTPVASGTIEEVDALRRVHNQQRTFARR